MAIEKNYGVWFAAAEPVIFDIKDKTSGKVERVTSCRVCVITYDSAGIRGMDCVKATPAFADYAAKHIGERFAGKAIACDTRGRACALYDV